MCFCVNYFSATPCTDDFLLQPGYSPSTLQGYPQSDVTTLDQCKLRCLNDASCTRFFYYSQNPRSQIYCYLYYTATDSVVPAQGIDLYIRQRCLNNVSITVATAASKWSLTSVLNILLSRFTLWFSLIAKLMQNMTNVALLILNYFKWSSEA